MSAFWSDAPGKVRPARTLLLVSAAVLALGWLRFDVPVWAALAGWLAIAAAAALAPAPRPAALSGRHAAHGPDPDTSPAAPALLSALPRPAFLLDGDGVVRFANREAERRFSATRVGDPFTATFRSPEISAALAAVESGTVVDYREPGRPGRVSTLSLNAVDGVANGGWTLVTADDVSERLAVLRMRADFVANASHELRTPLASLTGFIETLLGPARHDPEASERFLRIMQEQAGRMRRLIDDLLSLSRAEMRQHRPPTGTVDLASLVGEVADGMTAVAAENGVTISIHAAETPVAVAGDRDELFQVVRNLIENALRYGAAGGRIDVLVQERRESGGPAVAVAVQDYGPGIAPEHVPRLTERFYRVEGGSSGDQRGTGLGLAIVKHILSRHGARLEVASSPGEGSCFTALFPILSPENPDQAEKRISREA